MSSSRHQDIRDNRENSIIKNTNLVNKDLNTWQYVVSGYVQNEKLNTNYITSILQYRMNHFHSAFLSHCVSKQNKESKRKHF